MYKAGIAKQRLLAVLLVAGVNAGLAAPTPAFTATESGPVSSMTLVARIKVADADRNRTGNFYVAANLNGAWFTPSGRQWIAWHGGALPVYSSGVLDDRTIEVARNRSMLAYAGAKIYVGYGLDENDMRSNKKFAPVDTIPADPNLHLKKVAETDPGIRFNPSASHLYRTCDNNHCEDDDKLFVFFPGSDGSPLDHQRMADAIGSTGIRVLVLAYQNNRSVNAICGSNDACYADVRRARVEGSGSADPDVISGAADGIENRLLKALMSLHWTQFYSDDRILYRKIIFGGFSQGAGMATWIAKNHPVARVCQFSGTWDESALGKSATWLTQAGKTPPDSFYGFTHEKDLQYGVTYLNKNWEALGMGMTPPRLYTEKLEGQKIYGSDLDDRCTLKNAHGCSAVDASTPLNADGTPRFAGAWRYVCGRQQDGLRQPKITPASP